MYVKCMTPQVAAAAFNSLNGRFFAGECSLPFIAMFILCHVHVADDHHCVWGVGSLPFTLLASRIIARNIVFPHMFTTKLWYSFNNPLVYIVTLCFCRQEDCGAVHRRDYVPYQVPSCLSCCCTPQDCILNLTDNVPATLYHADRHLYKLLWENKLLI